MHLNNWERHSNMYLPGPRSIPKEPVWGSALTTPDIAASCTYGQGAPGRVMGLLGNECVMETFAEKARSRGCCVWNFLLSFRASFEVPDTPA